MPNRHPTTAEIDLEAFRHNVRRVKDRVGPRREILAVIKADAYGHGARESAAVLLEEGVRFLGVATVAEGEILREAGMDAAIVVLGGVLPEEYPRVLASDLIPVLYRADWAAELSRAARARGREAVVQIKVDTGMGRLGIAADEAVEEITRIASLPGLRLQGILSHFSDADLEDKEVTRRQLRLFGEIREALAGRGVAVPYWHLSNSAAVMEFPEAFFNMVRPGIMLYGYPPSPTFPEQGDLRPVLSWRTRIVHLKEVPAGTPLSYGRTFVTSRSSRIATLPVGYADGFSRLLSNRGQVLVRGRRVPVVGRVTMDMTLVDVTEVPEAAAGDGVTLIGEDGEDRITAWDQAAWSETIAYEVLCRIGRRVPRIYTRKQGVENRAEAGIPR